MNPSLPTNAVARVRLFERLTLFLGLVLMVLCLTVLFGWAFHIVALITVFPHLVTMKANTALGLGLSGLGLALSSTAKTGVWQRASVSIPATMLLALGGVTLGEYFSHWNPGIDELLFRDTIASVGTSAPGRMAPISAFCFVLSGVALGVSVWKIKPPYRVPILSALGTSLLIIGLVGTLGQFSNALNLAFWNYSGLAIHTALGFALLGTGFLTLVMSQGELKWDMDGATTFGFVLATIVMLTVAGISWSYTNQLQKGATEVSRSNEVLKAVENIRAGMASLENSQRGYVILDDDLILKPRSEIHGFIWQNLASLHQLLSNDAGFESRLRELESLIAVRNDFEQQTIEIRREKGFLAAQNLIASGKGKALIDQVGILLLGLRDHEYAQLIARQKEVDATATTTFLLLPAGVFLSLTILSLAFFFLNEGATEQKAAEAKLRESELQFRTMVNALPQLAWMAHEDGYIFWYNQRWFDYTGTSADQMEGWGWQQVHDPDQLPKVIVAWQASIASGQPFEMEFPLRAADGHFGWFLTRVFPFKDEAGRIVRWFGTNTDVSEQRAAAEEIRKLNATLEERVVERTAQLEAANKELEAFSYSVSHDLRAPLRAVDGFSQAVLLDYGSLLPEEGRQDLLTIRDGAQRMGRLIDDLLSFSRLSRSTLSKQEVNTGKLVHDVIEQLNAQRKGRQIKISVGELPDCQADPALVNQVWVNLISNALKYTRQREEAMIEIGCKSNGRGNVYFVRDNGAGFDMRYAHKLFGVFQRLHHADEFEGTGVGLAIVQRMVHRHDGQIWADAAVDRGATFYFTLNEKVHT